MLSIITEYRKGILFVRLKGSLNIKTREILKNKVTDMVSKSGITNLVINIQELDEIDLNGISEIFNNYLIVHKYAGRSFLCGINTSIDKTVKNSRILNYIPEINNELNAIKVIKWIG